MICEKCGIQIEPDGRVFYCNFLGVHLCEGCSKEKLTSPNGTILIVHYDCLTAVDQ